ncbi:SMP-30/gluconolactonase/LRE family protein [Nordella sp. HKS 07]|uniref:SMP-30/gluconolactonase/LRE family protein n=1 Tax=Nordella sp. HKS 07 TaxID=2712222 RepID=UPI0013E0EF93|nr:SMP-30/gluconolactonase/LRE family protein [Nordella sp. HKS 07]QIG48332.1 SMP-30/gluconolactonase/LRE family protein [Nordella sp. HKS 07]
MLRLIFASVLVTLAGSAQAEEVSVINPRALFPEGPILTDGKLYYAEYAGHTVMRWDGEKNTQVWKQDGCGPSAVIPMGDNFAVTCYDSGKLAVISKDGKDVASYDKDENGVAFVGPNDGVADSKGGIYFTTSGPWESGPIVGRVIHLTADGKLSEAADDLHYANGITFGPDKRLYVNESEAGRIISFAVAADGGLSDRRLFVRLYALGEPADAYPDGIKLGPDGNFYVGEYSAGNILVVTPDGKLATKYTVPSAASPNLTFSADGKTMYVMAVDNKAGAPYEGKVYSVKLK